MECDFSFSDLYKAAFGKNLSKKEKESFANLTQIEINRLVSKWAKKASWKTQDKKGDDGKIYLAFYP